MFCRELGRLPQARDGRAPALLPRGWQAAAPKPSGGGGLLANRLNKSRGTERNPAQCPATFLLPPQAEIQQDQHKFPGSLRGCSKPRSHIRGWRHPTELCQPASRCLLPPKGHWAAPAGPRLHSLNGNSSRPHPSRAAVKVSGLGQGHLQGMGPLAQGSKPCPAHVPCFVAQEKRRLRSRGFSS